MMSRLRALPGLLPLLLLTLSCSGCATPNADSIASAHATALTGDWGGEHVSLTLSPSGAFSVPGKHVPEHGGPVRMGEPPGSQAALYQGTVSGDRLQLRVTSNGAEVGSYQLRRGASAQLFRCL